MSYNCSLSAIRPDLVGEPSQGSKWLIGQLNQIKSDLYWPHRFSAISSFFESMGLPQPKGHWRLTEYRFGHFRAMTMSYGRLCATNGLTAYIIRSDDSLVKGLLPNFIADDEVEATEKLFSAMKAKGTTKARKTAGGHVPINLIDLNF